MPQTAERRLTYDKNLLREAEVVMQKQFQLRPNSDFASSSQANLAHPPQSNGHVRFNEMETPSGSVLPFWRTTKGIVLVVVVVLVIIGAVIGAAVWTTAHKPQFVTNVTMVSPSLANTTVLPSIGNGGADGTSSPGNIATTFSFSRGPPTATVKGISVETNPGCGCQHLPGSDQTTSMT